MVVLVTGANGQLGQSLQFIAENYPQIDFIFCSSAELDITNLDNCKAIFQSISPIIASIQQPTQPLIKPKAKQKKPLQ